MCHTSTHPGASLYVTQFYQTFPRVSTASNKLWSERPGYEAILSTHHTLSQYYMVELLHILPQWLSAKGENLHVLNS